VDASRDQYDEHPVAPGERAFDDLWVVRGSRNDSDALLECIELLHALLSAHADHVVVPIKRVLHHVPPELPRGPDDANPHRARLVAPSSGESVAVAPVLEDSLRCLMSPRSGRIAAVSRRLSLSTPDAPRFTSGRPSCLARIGGKSSRTRAPRRRPDAPLATSRC